MVLQMKVGWTERAVGVILVIAAASKDMRLDPFENRHDKLSIEY